MAREWAGGARYPRGLGLCLGCRREVEGTRVWSYGELHVLFCADCEPREDAYTQAALAYAEAVVAVEEARADMDMATGDALRDAEWRYRKACSSRDALLPTLRAAKKERDDV